MLGWPLKCHQKSGSWQHGLVLLHTYCIILYSCCTSLRCGFYFNLHEGIGWSMRAHTRCLSVGFLALMGRFRAGILHESCIEKAGGQLDLNWLCSLYFHNIRFEPFWQPLKSGADSHDERGTEVFFFAAVQAEFDPLLADDCTGEAPWPSMMSKCSFWIHTGPRHVFACFFPTGYYCGRWIGLVACSVVDWRHVPAKTVISWIITGYDLSIQSAPPYITLWSQFILRRHCNLHWIAMCGKYFRPST